jgi:ferredoxin like protein
MSIKRLSPEEALSLNKFSVDEGNPHIIVDRTICARCTVKPCLVICPAKLYRLKDGEMSFDYAGCLECGTCRVVCIQKGVTAWRYPGASYGVSFRCS